MNDLMADAAWTRRLATALLGDPSAAEDARQEAWLRARARPAEPAPADPRGWVRAVLANALRGQRRALLRRRHWEQEGAAAGGTAATPEELLGRLEVQKMIAQLVTGLDEPGRQMVLLRYYEGLTSAQIAAATGTPAGTVRWRLKESLARLRGQIERRYGQGGKDWRLVLLPLADVLAPPAGAEAAGAAADGARPGADPPAAAAPASAGHLAPTAQPATSAQPPSATAPHDDARASSPPAPRPSGDAGAPGVRSGVALDRRAPALTALGGGVAALALLLFFAARLSFGLLPGAASTAHPGSADGAPGPGRGAFDRGRRAIRGPGGGPPLFAAAALARDCPEEVAALEGALAEARAALAYHLPGRAAFHDAKDRPNPAGAAALAPVINRWLDERGAARERRELSCQGDACKLKVTEPWPPAPWVDRAPGVAAAAELDRVARAVEVQGPSQDREGLSQVAATWVWLRLRSPDGSPGDFGAPAPPLPIALLPSGALAPRGERPPRSEGCRQAVAGLEREIDALRLRAQKDLPAEVLFAKEPAPNPRLAARLQPMVDRAHAVPGGPDADRGTPLAVSCRGLVCKVQPPAGAQVAEKTMKRLLDDPELAASVQRVSLRSRNGRADPLYFSVAPQPDQTRSGRDLLRAFLREVRRDGVVEGCKARAPDPGKLQVHFLVPGDGETNHDGVARRISFRFEGTLAGQGLGHCLAEALGARADLFELPPEITRAEGSHTFEVP